MTITRRQFLQSTLALSMIPRVAMASATELVAQTSLQQIAPQGYPCATKFSTEANNLLRESAFCLIPAAAAGIRLLVVNPDVSGKPEIASAPIMPQMVVSGMVR